MKPVYTRYGDIVEITQVERKPRKVRLPAPRERKDVHGARRPDNIRRTKQICVRRVHAAIEMFGCPLLVTLTFNGDASDAAYANDSMRYFQMRLRTAYPKAISLFIPELSPRGRIHFHGLLFNVPLSLGDTRKGGRLISTGEEREKRTLAGLWGEGFVDAVQTDGSGRLAQYISKYITKGAGEVMFNAMRLIRISHGFPHEVVLRGKVAEQLAKNYAMEKPLWEWEGEHKYAGKVTKKVYTAKKS